MKTNHRTLWKKEIFTIESLRVEMPQGSPPLSGGNMFQNLQWKLETMDPIHTMLFPIYVYAVCVLYHVGVCILGMYTCVYTMCVCINCIL